MPSSPAETSIFHDMVDKEIRAIFEEAGLKKLKEDLKIFPPAQIPQKPQTRDQETQTDKPNIPALTQTTTKKSLSTQAFKNCPPQLKQAIEAIKHGKTFNSLKNFLLVGPSGTGKTTMVEAIATACDLPLLFCRGTLIADSYKNSGNHNIKTIFEEAIAHQPCVLVIDELNELFEKYDRPNDSDQGMLRTFWTMIDECKKHNIIFMGTLNHLKKLPSQIATRFPSIIKIDLPQEKERLEAIHFHMQEQFDMNKIIFSKVETETIAQKTDNFSLRDIASLIDLASLQAFCANKKQPTVTTNDILKIIPQVMRARDLAVEQANSSWSDTINTAAHYGFQITSAAGQMYFQKWMQDRQMNHTNMLHEDSKAHQTRLSEKQSSFAAIAKTALANTLIGAVATWIFPANIPNIFK